VNNFVKRLEFFQLVASIAEGEGPLFLHISYCLYFFGQ